MNNVTNYENVFYSTKEEDVNCQSCFSDLQEHLSSYRIERLEQSETRR